MKHRKWIALLLAAVLAVTAMSVTAFAANSTETEPETTVEDSAAKTRCGRHGHMGKIAEPENAVGKQAAKDAALADAGVSADEAGKVKARISKLEDGTVVYKVHFTSGDLWYSYRIDAVTGVILDKTTEDAARHQATKTERPDRDGRLPEFSEDGTETTGRGRRHGGGRRGSGSAEEVNETESNGGRRHEKSGKTAESAIEEGSTL